MWHILTQILLTVFSEKLPFCEKYRFAVDVSLWCELLCTLSTYTWKGDQWKAKWWAKVKLEFLLPLLIYSNSKFKVMCKNEELGCRYIRGHLEGKATKISTLHSPFGFSHKNTSTELSSWVLWRLLLLMKSSCAPKRFVLTRGKI